MPTGFPPVPQIQSDLTQTNTSTVDYIKNKVVRVWANPIRTLNSAFQISATCDTIVSYAVDIAATISLVTGQAGQVILEYADDAGMSTNLITVNSATSANTGALTIGLALTQTTTGTVAGVIPAGKYARLRTANTIGTPGFSFRSAQEITF